MKINTSSGWCIWPQVLIKMVEMKHLGRFQKNSRWLDFWKKKVQANSCRKDLRLQNEWPKRFLVISENF